jgi:hypothetical protein
MKTISNVLLEGGKVVLYIDGETAGSVSLELEEARGVALKVLRLIHDAGIDHTRVLQDDGTPTEWYDPAFS